MSNHIDKRGRLEETPFDFRISKNNTVFISYYGKEIKIVKGKEAEKLIRDLEETNNEKEEQLVLAKITGNYKRGNERSKGRR
ncbi:hypothetical protein LC087_17215 [Bacillus carboniphilus]|uniref:Uncharacterized protein n=1 Tax=Bacillus carboniphilus TaxID=86663 RepID=A0ABY9JUE6_9BACI|nr:hypothetical protein [Bacillus carboniphilus]WLR42419.1 hypothetical protein LC087_17215 [Bacillus carboniphilus]